MTGQGGFAIGHGDFVTDRGSFVSGCGFVTGRGLASDHNGNVDFVLGVGCSLDGLVENIDFDLDH